MFEVSLTGADELCEKLDTFSNHIKSMHFSIPAEFIDWQRQDLRRRNPHQFVKHTRRTVRVTTLIYERGIGSMPKAYRLRHAMPKGHRPRGRAPRQGHHGPHRWSTRPVLRPELQTKLFDRMKALFDKWTQWP